MLLIQQQVRGAADRNSGVRAPQALAQIPGYGSHVGSSRPLIVLRGTGGAQSVAPKDLDVVSLGMVGAGAAIATVRLHSGKLHADSQSAPCGFDPRRRPSTLTRRRGRDGEMRPT